MWRIEARIDIPLHQDRVFDYLSHFHHIQEWDPSVLTARPLSPGSPAAGSRFALTVLFGTARVPMVYEITTLTPGQTLILTGQAASFKAIDRIHCEPAAGGTRLTYVAEVHFPKTPGRLLTAVGERLFRLNAGRAVRRLRSLLSGTLPAPRLTLLTRMADQTLLPGALGFTRAGYRLARNRRPVAAALGLCAPRPSREQNPCSPV